MKSINDQTYYLNQLEQQLSLLVDSCDAYDSGKFYQAKSLSNNIRAIVRDVKNPTPKTRTKSLLYHLDRKLTMKFYNTGFKAKEPIISMNLVGMASVPSKAPTTKPLNEHMYFPLLNGSNQIDLKWLEFSDWWESEIIVYKSENLDLSITRESIVLTMVEQDGGTHVDSLDNIDINYLELATATKSLFSNVDKNGIESPIINLHYALVRQIAHELIISLKKEFNFSIDYNPSNKKNLRGVSETEIKQFGIFAKADAGYSVRTKNPYKEMIRSSFKTPENAAFVKIHF